MAISWGSWEYGSGNGMRVGIDVDATSVTHTSTGCKVTFAIYTQNQYNYSDNQELNISGTDGWGDVSFNNSSSGGSVKRSTKTYNYTFAAGDYGAGTAKAVTLTATISGAYNGVTPSKSVTYNIPRRPYGVPLSQLEPSATLDGSGTPATLSWVLNSTTARPYAGQSVDVWDNVSGAWANAGSLSGAAVSTTIPVTVGRRYLFRLSASNASGTSGFVSTDVFQSTPVAPSGCSVAKAGPTSIAISWTNGAQSPGYVFDTLVEERVGAGSWAPVATVTDGATSYVRTGRSPGSVYSYRVRARSLVGWETYSGYAESSSIQLQSPPNAPTVVSTVRSSDTSFSLNWTNNPVVETAPYSSLMVQRMDLLSGIWSTVATLSPTATSFNDTTTVVNAGYAWRVRAENSAGVSSWANFTTYQTKPAAPSNVSIKAAPGGAMLATWSESVGYTNFSAVVRYYKDGVAIGSPTTVSGGAKQHLLTGVTLTSSYRVEVKLTSSVGYSSESAWVSSSSIPAATVPNAPTGLSPTGVVIDMGIPNTMSWTHAPSEDNSPQTAYEFSTSTDGGSTWVDLGKVSSASSSLTTSPNPSVNGLTGVLFRVRTWGVHATASPWSAYAQVDTSTTPTVTLTTPDDGTLEISRLDVAWTYADAESQVQTFWEVELRDELGALLESRNGTGSTSSLTLDTVAVDGASYLLRVRAWGADGLKSLWVERSLVADFTPPALPLLAVEYSQSNGTTILTLTPTAVTGGTLPVTGVDVQRRFMDSASGEYLPWETIVSGVSEDAVLVDTIGPIAGDGEYRAIAYSAAPSSAITDPVMPSGQDDRWVYLSGGTNFQRSVRLMGNVALRTTAGRERVLHHFAGRPNPVLFSGEARNRAIEVAGLLDGESSSPEEWERMILDNSVMLFRDPLGHRLYGSVDQVSIDFLGSNMHAIAFVVTEVAYP